ncbi:MAG: EAL domain-containing protein [Gammaproteobacteria bacterium]|nr:EAL domain-containing protein [Gammaproteobacteria bacterium]
MKRTALLHSLRTRLLVLIILAALPGTVVTVWTALVQRQASEDSARDEMREAAATMAARYERRISSTKAVLTTLSEFPPVTAAPNACAAELRSILHIHDDLANLAFINAGGYVSCSAVAPPSSDPVYLGDRPYFHAALTSGGRVVTSGFIMGRLVHRPVQILAKSFTAPGHRPMVVYTSLDLSTKASPFLQVDIPAGGRVMLLDSDGGYLGGFPADLNRYGDQVIPADVLQRIHGAGPKGDLTAKDSSGHTSIFGYAALATGQAYAIASIPRATAFAAARLMLARNLAILGIGLTLALLAGWRLIATQLLRKSTALRQAAEKIAAGELQAKSGLPPGRDELGIVASAFDTMTDALAERTREADKFNRIQRMLTAISRAQLRTRDIRTLLQEACRIAVDYGELRLAWVGQVDAQKQRVTAIAHYGHESDYMEGASLSLAAESPESGGLVGTALRTGRPAVTNDFLRDPRLAPWYPLGKRLGFGGGCAFPIVLDGKPRYVFTVYTADSGFFNPQDLALLEQLTADIAYGLHALEMEQQAGYLANYDPLTGLFNRQGLLLQVGPLLVRTLHNGRHAAVVTLEITNFHQIADELGQVAADELLRLFAVHLREVLRAGDIASRVLDTRFCMVLADMASPDDVRRVMEHMFKQLPHELDVAGKTIVPKLRAGVAISPADASEAEQLLDFSQRALHALTSEPVVFFAPAINLTLQENRKLELALRQALDEETLELHYQPVVDSGSRHVRGFEALARWPSGPDGAVPPGRFIPLAESCGLIVPLGDWALRTAARQAAYWERQGRRRLQIAVNVSPLQFREERFLTRVTESITATGATLRNVNLAMEITENLLIHNLEEVRIILVGLKELGIALYLDDFGTGYSSLGYLHNLPFDVVKIDQSFTRQLGVEARSEAMVKTIVALAGQFGLAVIAEGVETEEQLAMVRKLRCKYVQGFLTGRPMPAAEAERLLGPVPER